MENIFPFDNSFFRRRQWHPTPVLLPGKSHGWRSLVAAVHGVAGSRTQLSDFTFTFHFHELEKEMANHSSVLAWRIPGMGQPGGLLSMGSHRVGHEWSNLAAALSLIKRMPGIPLASASVATKYTAFPSTGVGTGFKRPERTPSEIHPKGGPSMPRIHFLGFAGSTYNCLLHMKTAPEGKDRGISFLLPCFYMQSFYKVISLWLATDLSPLGGAELTESRVILKTPHL